MKMRLFFLLGWLAIFFLACTPRLATLHLTPEQDSFNEQQIVQLENEEIRFECDFLQATPYDLLFQVKIDNHSSRTAWIVPQDFYYEALDGNGRILSRQYAFDPEDLLFEIDASIADDQRAIKTTNTLGWIFFGLDVVATAVGVANNDENAPLYAIESGVNLLATQAETAAMKRHVVYLQGERAYYDNAAIRDTTLAPGDRIEGLIVFPRLDAAEQLRFRYEISGEPFIVTYRQRWEQVEGRGIR